MQWKKATLIGVGLLGGSLGLAIKRHNLAGQVVGYVRRKASLDECARLGVVDYATLELGEAVNGADLIVFCTPVSQMGVLANQMIPYLSAGAIVTDVGSVKMAVIKALEKPIMKSGAFFVGSHPMAGGEKMGMAAARADLFENAICIITPTKKTKPEAAGRVRQLWEATGMKVISMSPSEHDVLVSRSSHLPHVVAAALVNMVLADGHKTQQAQLCATGFRDTTRIASGSPEMWRDISLANRRALSEALRMFTRELSVFRKALLAGDAAALEKFFADAKTRRDNWKLGAESHSQE